MRCSLDCVPEVLSPPPPSLSPVAQVLLVLFSVFFPALHRTRPQQHITRQALISFLSLCLACCSPSFLLRHSQSRVSGVTALCACVRVCDISFLREDEPCTARTFTQRITNTHPHKESQILTHTTRAHTYTQTQTYTRTQTLSSQQ